jgi:hypothetical protein
MSDLKEKHEEWRLKEAAENEEFRKKMREAGAQSKSAPRVTVESIRQKILGIIDKELSKNSINDMPDAEWIAFLTNEYNTLKE